MIDSRQTTKDPTHEESCDTPTRKYFRFRLWHTFVIVAVAAWVVQNYRICGSTPAVVQIKTMKVTYDEQWKKHWAILQCEFIKPEFDPTAKLKQTFRCFFAVEETFDFGDKYSVGDELRFRFQLYDFGPLEKSDPRIRVLDKCFAIKVMPTEYEGNLFVLVSELETKDEDQQ